MKKIWALALTLLIALSAVPAFAVPQSGEQAEWTVLFYLCGSDLESKYGYATGNLEEISRVQKPRNLVNDITDSYGFTTKRQLDRPGRVNVLIETGGAEEWHTEGLGMDVRTDRLQYWRFEPQTDGVGSFHLEGEKPLASMARPETLTEFIRWSAEKYPAKKYALVLWNHGGGSKTGIFIDELFSGEYMALDMLRDALAAGGVHFETLLFDACMMANIETAFAVCEHADWMVASEELVAGKGTAIESWLQELYYLPQGDGRVLGRWICDMTQIKYANEDDEQTQQLMTWSVIRLAAIPRLALDFDEVFAAMCACYEKSPRMLDAFCDGITGSETYGTGAENMYDLAGIFYQPALRNFSGQDLQWEMQSALMDAVDYCLRGAGRPAARGISYCYAADFDNGELQAYSHNCPSAHYLALLDAISPWTAPEWVYETIAPLPDWNEMSAYRVRVEKRVMENGTPAICLPVASQIGVSSVLFSVYRYIEEPEQLVSLGTAPAYGVETEEGLIYIVDNPVWPAVEGVHCEIEVLKQATSEDFRFLFNVPIQIGTEMWYLRCAYLDRSESYVVYGIWEGFDSDSELFSRNVRSLSQMAGQEYRLLYPVFTDDIYTRSGYEASETMTMLRALEIEDKPLPPGTYYIQFVVYDMFLRPMPLEMIEMRWDGESLNFADDLDWSGEVSLQVPEKYWE